jgi:4-hydroxybenzoate polyprenyltransferase
LYASTSRQTHQSKGHRPGLLAAYAKVARFEYLPAELLLITIPVLLVVTDLQALLSIKFLEGVTVFFLLYFTGFMSNALADRGVDAIYSSYKSGVAQAVEVLGTQRLKAILGTHVIVALLLSVHLFMLTGNPMVLLFVGLGLFLGIGYSAGPFHFKTRGVAHGLALASSAFFLPMVFIVVTVTGALDFLLLMFITGFTMAMYSLEFGNQAMDYFEDLRSNLRTPSVRYSVRGTVGFSLGLLALGLLISSVTLGSMLVAKVGLIHPFFAELAVLIVPTVLIVGFLAPAIGLARIYQETGGSKGSHENDTKRMRAALRQVDHPKWQASGAFSVVLVCALMFTGVFFPLANNSGPSRQNVRSIPVMNILNNPDTVVNVGDEVDLQAEIIGGGKSLSMFWNFGDGTGLGGFPNATHRYTKMGTYTVEFKVIDSDLNQVSQHINITVTQLYFSKLELKAESLWPYTHLTYDFNVTNDKDLKHQDELVVQMYYQNFMLMSQGLDQELYPAKVWPNQGTMDLATLDKDISIRVVLLQYIGNQVTVVQDIVVKPE